MKIILQLSVLKVASAWATKYGLLLERVSHCRTDGSPDPALTLTTLFSVIHPLHEISPILSIKQGFVYLMILSLNL